MTIKETELPKIADHDRKRGDKGLTERSRFIYRTIEEFIQSGFAVCEVTDIPGQTEDEKSIKSFVGYMRLVLDRDEYLRYSISVARRGTRVFLVKWGG